MKATALDVMKLQAKRLNAADDSPLVANQTDPDAFDITKEDEKSH